MKFKRIRLTDITRREFAREGTELRTLLRSRPVQGVLVLTAAMQTLSIVGGEAKEPVAATKPASQPVAQVAARLTPTLSAAVKKEAVVEKKDEAEAKAAELAAEYREKGYRVPSTLAEQIVDAAEEHDIEPEVAFGLVATESGFKRTARSHVGAIGLAQLMPATARWLEPGTTRKDLEDPETNLRLGFRYLRDMIDKYDGDTELALTAYNRGPGTVDRVLRRGGDPDNGYAGKVLGSE